MLHRIFQVHHIPPQQLYAMSEEERLFIYASEAIVMEQEEEQNK